MPIWRTSWSSRAVKLNQDETPEQALVRELQEEVGITVPATV
jgi:ADP-ribose pyrophosphatase YjhB (NUDIX family)